MKLKSYLNFDADRPLAGFVKDAIINKHVKNGKPSPNVMANTVLQTWHVNVRPNSRLPRHIAGMLRVAGELNMRLDMQMPSQEVHRQIPIWHHIGFKEKTQKRYGSKAYKCLAMNHRVETAGEAADATKCLSDMTHTSQKNCKCDSCRRDRMERGCENPHKCAVAAKNVLDKLVEKWDPRRPNVDNEKGLSPADKEHNLEESENNGVIRFDPGMDNEDSLTDGIRIFTSGWDTCPRQASRNGRPETNGEDAGTISVAYTDGSAYNNGTAEARAGAGVWFGDNDERNISIRLPGPHQTNNSGEIRAV
ncbi:uncharacterized protein EV420DRAFT_1223420, partial [Desarmillaria tabescens]